VIGRGAYERLRARAMTLMLRYTALRISDVAATEWSRVRDGQIHIRTAKNGDSGGARCSSASARRRRSVVPVSVLERERFPARVDSRRVAHDENGVRRPGVKGACSHRFRHTLATEVLELGGTFEEASDILGDSVGIVRKHYAKWSESRQARINELLPRIWHAKKSSPQATDNEGGNLVDGVGLEPTTPALRTRCSPN
jgi:integrase